MLTIEWVLVFLCLGGLVGFVSGLLGVGGGGILVPVLSSLFHMQGNAPEIVMHMALGTSMACVISTSISSFFAHWKSAAINWNIAINMAPGAIMGAVCGTFFVTQIPSLALVCLFTIFMAYNAVKMYRDAEKPFSGSVASGEISPLRLYVSSSIIGLVSSLVSIGGGSLIVPWLTSHQVHIKQAIAISAFLGVVISVPATLTYLIAGVMSNTASGVASGFISIPAVLTISMGGFLLAPLGARAAHRLPALLLKKIFVLLLLLLSINMLVKMMSL